MKKKKRGQKVYNVYEEIAFRDGNTVLKNVVPCKSVRSAEEFIRNRYDRVRKLDPYSPEISNRFWGMKDGTKYLLSIFKNFLI